MSNSTRTSTHQWTHRERVYLGMLASQTSLDTVTQNAVFNNIFSSNIAANVLRSQRAEATRTDRTAAHWAAVLIECRDYSIARQVQLVNIGREAVSLGVTGPFLQYNSQLPMVHYKDIEVQGASLKLKSGAVSFKNDSPIYVHGGEVVQIVQGGIENDYMLCDSSICQACGSHSAAHEQENATPRLPLVHHADLNSTLIGGELVFEPQQPFPAAVVPGATKLVGFSMGGQYVLMMATECACCPAS